MVTLLYYIILYNITLNATDINIANFNVLYKMSSESKNHLGQTLEYSTDLIMTINPLKLYRVLTSPPYTTIFFLSKRNKKMTSYGFPMTSLFDYSSPHQRPLAGCFPAEPDSLLGA